MLDDKLKELVEYIDEINKMNPFDFLLVETDRAVRIEFSEEQKKLGEIFYQDIRMIIKKYERNIDPSIMTKELFNVFIDFLDRKQLNQKLYLLE